MDLEVQLRYQLDAAERIAGRLRQDEEADPRLVAALDALVGETRQRLDEVAGQRLARDSDAASPD
jgi:hypothetical protein